jgi:hypothetical protein
MIILLPSWAVIIDESNKRLYVFCDGLNDIDVVIKKGYITKSQCCGSGSRIRCLFDPWFRDPGWAESQHPDPG